MKEAQLSNEMLMETDKEPLADTNSAITISSLNSDVDKNLPGSITIGMAWGTF